MYNNLIKFFILFVFIISFYVVSQNISLNKKNNNMLRVLNSEKLQILNGCGIQGKARFLTKKLRKKGFDVLMTGNYSNFNLPYSLLIVRKNKTDILKDLQEELNIDKVFFLKDSSLYDYTILIGKDK